jgi:hypothetical protein
MKVLEALEKELKRQKAVALLMQHKAQLIEQLNEVNKKLRKINQK